MAYKVLPLSQNSRVLPDPCHFFQQDQFLCENYPPSIIDNSIKILFFKKGKIWGLINLTLYENKVYSPFRAPYGGFQFFEEANYEEIKFCITTLEKVIESYSIKGISMRLPPAIYDQANSGTIYEILNESGYKIVASDINQHLVLSRKDFELLVSPAKRNRLRKAQQNKFEFHQLSPHHLPGIYQIIKESRIRKKYPITMKQDELQKMANTFPDKYQLFGVIANDNLIAAAVTIVVNTQILYAFYTGDTRSHIQKSPTVFLYQGLYNYARENQFRILDMGISSDKGVLNKGIHQFKLELGAIDSQKLLFSKTF